MTKSIKFADVTLRDGQQSIAATRMTTEQALRVLKLLDKAGYETLELWGGATLDSCVRFLNEDPWERLEAYSRELGGSRKIRALIRGQNLFAYQPFADDLVIDVIKQSIQSGVGVMRIFDALNDGRNLQIPMLASKAYGAQVEASICYTTSPVHTTDYFVGFAKKMVEEGADRLALKDMAGLLQPDTALELIPRLLQECDVPLTFHAHCTTGLALLNSVIAMQAGVDMIDTCITPFAGGTAHPPVEVLIVFAEKMGIRHDLDENLVLKIQAELFKIYNELQENIPNYGQFYRPFNYKDVNSELVNEIINLVRQSTPESVRQAVPLARKLMQSLSFPAYDERILESQIPGGMLSNLQSQLKQMGMNEILDQVMQEVPRVRKDMGYVTLVTPTSQIVGSQATFNVMTGQPYSMMSNETKMLLRGEFGKPPAPFNQQLVDQVLSENGHKQIKYRPGSYLQPVLEDTAKPAYIKTHKDLLLHFMLGQPADEFLQKRN